MKVKFTKLAALLLAGAALLASGCTDYEVDIQKANQRIDQLNSEKATVAELNSQVDALKSMINTLETTLKADHKADVDKLNKAISDLETALKADYQQKIQEAVNTLNASIDKKLDKTTFEAAKKQIEDAIAESNARIKAIEDADFQKQINDLTTTMNNALATIDTRLTDLEDNKADKEQVAKDIAAAKTALEKTIADVESVLNGKINALDERVKKAEKAIEDLTKEGGVIDQLEAQIENLEKTKVNVTDFEAYKTATAGTIRLMQEAIDKLTDTKLDKSVYDAKMKEIDDNLAAINAKFNDYVLTSTFEDFVKIAATKAELENIKNVLSGRLDQLEALTAGFPEGTTIKQYVDNQITKLQGELDKITNADGTGRLDLLEGKVDEISENLDKVLAQLKFVEDYEGGLQAYIDDAAQKAYDDACAYTDEWFDALYEWTYYYLSDIYDWLYDIEDRLVEVEDRVASVLKRIQSVQFVPEYDDLKITTNMAYFTMPGVEGVVPIDQPTLVTYQILPAQYADEVAMGVEDFVTSPEYLRFLIWYYYGEEGEGPFTREEIKEMGLSMGILPFFDVKPLETRAANAIDRAPKFAIVGVEGVDTTKGEVTFKVMPYNVASAQFAANDIQPTFVFTADFDPGLWLPLLGWVIRPSLDPDPNALVDEFGYLFENGTMYWPSYDKEALDSYRNRSAFAAQLRLYAFEDFDVNEDATSYDDYYIDYENELASPYNVLFPAFTSQIEVLADPYKREEDGTIRAFYTGNNIPEGESDEVHLTLPYNSTDYRIILEDAVAAYVIDGELMSYEQATDAGYIIPEYKISDKAEIEYIKNSSKLVESNYFVDPRTYAWVEMNAEAAASARMLEIGNQVKGTYTFTSELMQNSFTASGDVTITKEEGAIDLNALIQWTWAEDADTDHNLFYGTGEDPQIYSREQLEINIDEEGKKALEDELGITLESFNDAVLVDGSLKITNCDTPKPGESAEQKPLPLGSQFDITNITIKDGKLYADISAFEWDKTYRVTASFELEYATIDVTFILTTVDRNREKVVLPTLEYTFDINGADFQAEDPVENSWYKWVSDPQHEAIFTAFKENGVISDTDFKDQAAFNAGELEGELRMADPSGSAAGYVDFNRDEIVLKTMTSFTAEYLKSINSGEQDETDPYVFKGNTVTRNVTTYIGEEVEIPMVFNYRVPAYDFLHQGNYTFDDGKWYTMASPKYFYNKKALEYYDVEYMNVPALAFNIIDKNNRFFNYKDEVAATDPNYFYDKNLFINFYYSGPDVVDTTPLEEQSQTTDWYGNQITTYGGLWYNSYDEGPYYWVEEAKNFEHCVFYYRSIRDAIPMYGTLSVKSGGVAFDIPTSFEKDNAGKYVAKQDYSSFELRAWKPFYVENYDQTLTIDLDEHRFYYVNVLEGLQFYDMRQVAASTAVTSEKFEGEGVYSFADVNYGVKAYYRPMLGFQPAYVAAPRRDNQIDYETKGYWYWIAGNTDADGKTYKWDSDAQDYVPSEEHSNGFYLGVSSFEAYDLQVENFVFDANSGVPQNLRRLITVYQGDNYYELEFDYNSQIEFQGTAEVSFSFDFQTPWQEFEKPFTVKVVLKGLDQQ